MNLRKKHDQIISDAIKAIHDRGYYTPYPENPKAYNEDLANEAKRFIPMLMNNNFNELLQTNTTTEWIGTEVSPYLQTGIGIKYPKPELSKLLDLSKVAMSNWSTTDSDFRIGILVEMLEKIKNRFFDIAYATMHSTGQSFMMSFQASGPHSNDRALEAAVMGYLELNRFIHETDWVKPLGKFDLKIHKKWKAIPKGIGLAIGCSTFPVWNTVPAIFANLITGNTCIVKPHPKAILPIAIVIAEMQKVLHEHNLDVHAVQLAVDTLESPITKLLAENESIKIIDFTGGSEFGSYVESLQAKTVFTEKAGVNSIIIDSVNDIKAVAQNIAFSACLYSGQMCTAPQNIFIPSVGIKSNEVNLTFDETVSAILQAIQELTDNPKAGPATLGAIQTDATLRRIKDLHNDRNKILLASHPIKNEEFTDARTLSPVVIGIDAEDYEVYNKECFGPILFIIKTNNTTQSIEIAKKLVKEKGALTCSAYTTDLSTQQNIEEAMNEVFAPVSFNFTGAAFINSHAAFSDFHVTGGNAAGNASLTNSEFIAKRYVWVGNRYC
jgi:phenylacetic acid degradation protein paaN